MQAGGKEEDQKSAEVVTVVRVVLVVIGGCVCSFSEAINHLRCGRDATK